MACKSLSVSNGRFLASLGLAASELAGASRVWPSGGALTTAAVAIEPPAPARFSITTGLPSRSCSFGAIARITTSMLPPGGNDTMKVTGPVGKPCAHAVDARMLSSGANSNLRRVVIGPSCGHSTCRIGACNESLEFVMALPPLPTSLVGSYAQPDWLIDRKKLAGRFPPRVRAKELWRVAPDHL